MRRVALVRQGTKFERGYIDLFKDHDPIVLTDDTYPEERFELSEDWPGWWSKLELFGPQFRKHRPCLFLDLDTYVMGNIDDLLEFESDEFWMLRDFNVPTRGQSAVMLIPRETGEIYRRFKSNAEAYMKMHRAGGDQDFLNDFPFRFLQDRFEGIKSYKRHGLKEAPDGRIVCFHGYPKPHETEGWARDIWNSVRP